MTTTVKGKVATTSVRKATSKAGRAFTIHYVELDTGQSVNVGFKQPFSVGMDVILNCEEKFGELKMLAPGTPVVDSSPGTTTKKEYGSGKNTRFPVPRDHGDYSIIRQNALTNAVNFYDKAVASGTTAPMGSINDAVEEIIKVAYKFAEFSSGHREERILKEMGAGAKVE